MLSEAKHLSIRYTEHGRRLRFWIVTLSEAKGLTCARQEILRFAQNDISSACSILRSSLSILDLRIQSVRFSFRATNL